jgi:hypothetical protein
LYTPSEIADVEQRNMAQIARLNQRGGRMLSIVDLIEAGTLSVEMAAFCRLMVLGGTSWLTAAIPGGAGKTTIMAALFGFLPPGERIVSVQRGSVVNEAPQDGAATMLAHEISPGPMHGYIWGQDVADFFALTRRGLRCVTCLHTDNPNETAGVLHSLGVASEDLDRVRLQLHIHVGGPRSQAVRRVAALHCRLDGRLRPAFQWQESDDAFERLVPRGELAALLAADEGVSPQTVESRWLAGERAVEQLRADGVHRFEGVRCAMLDLGSAWGPQPAQ